MLLLRTQVLSSIKASGKHLVWPPASSRVVRGGCVDFGTTSPAGLPKAVALCSSRVFKSAKQEIHQRTYRTQNRIMAVGEPYQSVCPNFPPPEVSACA
eukprot:576681-Prorocentrum_minimum.AAC.2